MDIFIQSIKNLLSSIDCEDNLESYNTLTKYIRDCIVEDNSIDLNLLEMITMIDKKTIFDYINLLEQNGMVRYIITLYEDNDCYALTKNTLLWVMQNEEVIINGNTVKVGDHNIRIEYFKV